MTGMSAWLTPSRTQSRRRKAQCDEEQRGINEKRGARVYVRFFRARMKKPISPLEKSNPLAALNPTHTPEATESVEQLDVIFSKSDEG